MNSDARETPRDGDEQQIQVQSDEQLPQSGPHEPIARPKIPKNKLPSVFNPAKKKRQDKPEKPLEPSQENEPKRASTDKPQRKQPNDQPRKHHSKKSMNPLIPARNQIRLFDKLEEEIMEARQDYQRFAKLNIDKLASPAPLPLRLEQSLTLSQRVTSRGTLLKRVLNVPTFRVLHLEELPISSRDTPAAVKASLEAWDSCPPSPSQLRSHSMFWNMPEGNISIIYDFAETVALAQVAEAAGYLPEPVLRQLLKDFLPIAQASAKNGVNIDGMEEIIHVSKLTGRALLIPQVEVTGKDSAIPISLLAAIAGKQAERETEKNFVFRMGYIMMKYSLGGFEFTEEVEDVLRNYILAGKVAARNSSCCLLHTLDSICEASPDFALYRLARRRFSGEYADLLCQLLRYNWTQRLPLEAVRSHRFFLQSPQPSKVTLLDLLSITTPSCQEIRDFSKIEQTIDLVLSNCVKISMPAVDAKTVQVLAEQTGVDPAVVTKRVTSLYAGYAK